VGVGDPGAGQAAGHRSPVLSTVGAQVERIYLTGVVDVTAGTSGIYDFGKVGKDSVGLYRLEYQGATAVDAEPLGAQKQVTFELIENTAGVFQVAEMNVIDTDIATDTTMVAVADAALDGATPDSEATVFVATAADVTDAAAWTAAKTLKAGHLYLLDALAAAVHCFKITRVS
jgi:hypothetical protein